MNVGTALQNAMRGIEAANQKHLYGVFGDTQWTNKDRLPDALLKDLLEHSSALNLGNRRVNSDIIGMPTSTLSRSSRMTAGTPPRSSTPTARWCT